MNPAAHLGPAHLDEEARYLYRALFSKPIDDLTIERYADAHQQLFPELAPTALLENILVRRLDAEAVEVALRRRSPSNPLTRKFQILSYLAEVQPDQRPAFYQLTQSRAGAWAAILAALVRHAWKSVKGVWVVKQYGLR
jgi:hypothetical protein